MLRARYGVPVGATAACGIVQTLLTAIVCGVVGVVAAVGLGATAAPLPFYAYPFLVLTFIGWISSLLRSSE